MFRDQRKGMPKYVGGVYYNRDVMSGLLQRQTVKTRQILGRLLVGRLVFVPDWTPGPTGHKQSLVNWGSDVSDFGPLWRSSGATSWVKSG